MAGSISPRVCGARANTGVSIPGDHERRLNVRGADRVARLMPLSAPERVRASGRDRLPDLRHERPRPRTRMAYYACWTERRRVATKATRGRFGTTAHDLSESARSLLPRRRLKVSSSARARSGPIPGTVSQSDRSAPTTAATLLKRSSSARADEVEMPGTEARSASVVSSPGFGLGRCAYAGRSAAGSSCWQRTASRWIHNAESRW
jgi:hypothetical protein